ncbi:ABC transporter ATP-binding protein [Pelobium manganitolerans]|uniref:ABC transporter ATP-binding protein n=1 Tax=Pelobium manganitolerans TaxID=1842495 RepID=A0A419SBX7_9SPHI|nr:ATP-binding cassette domain-containing protein [Pelobium manganitolerans]RKD20335.1 ABC transporter ATP-binding protein [Pelobium manganitolerans]
MEITLSNIGRRFNREWIFRNIDYTFKAGEPYAILGINGSGKSTLLQIISGALGQSEGKIAYTHLQKEIAVEAIFAHLAIAAPYLELIEDFTLSEVLDFHFRFKKRLNNISNPDLLALLNMQSNANKQLKYFSSGMKQRVKLALAFCSDTAMLLLDEPTSNLDQQGVDWYLDLVNTFTKDRLVLVCSNQSHEYEFCPNRLHIANYK